MHLKVMSLRIHRRSDLIAGRFDDLLHDHRAPAHRELAPATLAKSTKSFTSRVICQRRWHKLENMPAFEHVRPQAMRFQTLALDTSVPQVGTNHERSARWELPCELPEIVINGTAEYDTGLPRERQRIGKVRVDRRKDQIEIRQSFVACVSQP